MSRETIAFIDDESAYAMRYVRELLKSFDTHYFDNASDGLSYCLNNPKLRVIVIDIMMPPPADLNADDVNDGLSTGIWVLRKLQAFIESSNIGVIVLSQKNIGIVQGEVESTRIPERQLIVKSKMDVPAWNLPILIQQLIDRISG